MSQASILKSHECDKRSQYINMINILLETRDILNSTQTTHGQSCQLTIYFSSDIDHDFSGTFYGRSGIFITIITDKEEHL